MNFLLSIIDSLVGFVQRNPLTTSSSFFWRFAPRRCSRDRHCHIYILMGLILLVVGLMLLSAAVYKMRKQMEEQFGRGDPGRAASARHFTHEEPRARGPRRQVRVHRTSDAPEKRVSSDVGDYIDFEEEKN